MLHQLNDVIQIVTASVLGLVCILLVKHSKSGHHTWTGIGFTISILCYVIIESEAIQSVPGLKYIALLGAICIPVQFWLLAKAIFDDHFTFTPRLIGWFFLQFVPHVNLFISDVVSWSWFVTISSITAGVVSLGFVLAGLYTALKTKQSDLIDSRLKFRGLFIIATATLIGVTLIVEAIPIDPQTITSLQVLQRTSILLITLYFLVTNFGIRPGFFFREISKPKTQPADDPLLRVKLQSLMEEKKIYKKEGLTIRELAESMNEQEYRLRKLINGQLGFRNFNDFLNQYRIHDACGILSDPVQVRKTILEIAYDLGYQSIGPFNKAFRDLKGVTPTTYRKSQLNG